jgi:hypothetical protein
MLKALPQTGLKRDDGPAPSVVSLLEGRWKIVAAALPANEPFDDRLACRAAPVRR